MRGPGYGEHGPLRSSGIESQFHVVTLPFSAPPQPPEPGEGEAAAGGCHRPAPGAHEHPRRHRVSVGVESWVLFSATFLRLYFINWFGGKALCACGSC